MTETRELDIWTWLASCRKCGKPHQWRWTCTRPGPHDRHDYPYTFCEGGTWAHPADGHGYERRLAAHLLEPLKVEFEAVTAGIRRGV
jgi:hypothetical protein